MEKIGIGVIGCGAIANRAHLPAYRASPETRLVAVADIDEKKAEKAARQFNVPHWYKDYNRLLEHEDIDAVSICVPPILHAEVAIQAAEQNKHILCEKPISLTLDDAEQMIQAAKKNNVLLMIGHHLRFQDNLRKLKEYIEDRSLGKIVMVKSHWLGKSAIFGGWRTQSDYYKRRHQGGDILFNYGTHITDLIRWLCGDIIRVHAQSDIYGAKPDIKVHDRANLLLRFKSGIIGDISLGYFPYEEHWIEVIGTRGRVICDLFRNTMDIRYASRNVQTTFKQMKSGWIKEIEHFIQCIRQNSQPEISGEDGKKALEIVIAAYISQETQKMVALPLT